MVRQFYIQLVGRDPAFHTLLSFSPATLAVSCRHLLLLLLSPQNEIHGLIERYSVNESLVEEIEKLREENRKLKANY